MTSLFDPISLRGLTAKNRIWVSPMCQYSVEQHDGVPTDWHLVHLGSRAVGGFGLIITEATAVSADGRISPEDTGLWNSGQVDAWRRIVDFVHGQHAHIGVQLAHAGRKSSTYAPWHGKNSVPADRGGWQTVAPSAIAFGDYAKPRALTISEIDDIVTAFADAAGRAAKPGSTWSRSMPHTAISRTSSSHRWRTGAPMSTAAASRTGPASCSGWSMPFGRPGRRTSRWWCRISATDWVEGGWTIQDSTELATLLAERGVDLIDVSSGGLDPAQEITVGPGYQVPFARDVRTKADVTTGAVGLITEPRRHRRSWTRGRPMWCSWPGLRSASRPGPSGRHTNWGYRQSKRPTPSSTPAVPGADRIAPDVVRASRLTRTNEGGSPTDGQVLGTRSPSPPIPWMDVAGVGEVLAGY